jgi:outer membrane protein assembly factor BamB
LFALLCSVSSMLVAADWNEFRGPGGVGHYEQPLPTQWSETENIDWKVPVPGQGWSSPVVADNRIFVTTAVAEKRDGSSGHSLRLLCYDARTGATDWDVEAFWQPDGDAVEIHEKNSHASPTPILEAGRVYVHFGPHGTACFDTSGKKIWTTQALQYLPLHGNGGSPVLSDELLIVNCDGRDVQYVAALRKADGELVWQTPRDTSPSRGFSFCTPTIINVDGQLQAVCPGSTAVFAYDPDSGKEIWRVDYGEGYSVVPKPQFAHGLVYICTGFGDARLLAIDPTGKGNITDSHVRWSTGKGVPKSSTPIIVGKLLFMVDDNGIASCLDAVSGEEQWKSRLTGKYSASPLLADGLLYFQNETGTTTVIRAEAAFEKVNQNQLGSAEDRTFATFAVVDNDLLLRTETHLYRITVR